MPKGLWAFLIVLETLVVAAFAYWLPQLRYFQKMPAAVRHGASIERLVAERVFYLVLIFSMVNLSFWLWSRGVRSIERGDKAQGAATMGTSMVIFVFAGLCFIGLIIFGFAQY